MSEPVTHAEIEDVLSSIRRLVSDDGRAEPAAKAAKPGAPQPGRLVLTPALRVPERLAASAGEAAAAAPVNGAAVQEPPAEAELPEAAAESAADAAPFSDWEETSRPVPAAEAEAPWVRPGATLFAAAGQQEAAEPEPHPAGNDGLRSARAAAVVQKIAELEAKVARSQDQWEPDGRSADPYSGTANVESLQWEDHSAEVSGAPEQAALAEAPAGTGAGELFGALDGEESILDEETLRELVAEIVRTELQGALGERITRNVRKLVRREIQRALAAQDLL